MRRLVSSFYASLDGVVDAPERFTGPYFNPEVGETVGELTAAGDTLLLGRKTYDQFSAYFTSAAAADNPMAAQMTATPKLVASTESRTPSWQNSVLLTGDVNESIARLKEQPGKNINTAGSPTLVRSLLRAGLVDELHLLTFPVIVGGGGHLFDEVIDQLSFALVGSRALSHGVVHLAHERQR